MADITNLSSCNTCKTSFPELDLVKIHYRSDWHCFNSKRRSNGLAPVNEKDFKRFQNSSKKKDERTVKHQLSDTNKLGESHVNLQPTSHHIRRDELAAEHDVLRTQKTKQLTIEKSDDDLKDMGDVNTSNTSGAIDCDEIDEALQHDMDLRNGCTDIHEEPQLPLGANVSIFDNKILDSVEECVQYMELRFGFFIPDREYIYDLEGLLLYLGEKVKLGGVCLYCQRNFFPGTPCQNHMISKSHCKIAYEDDIDMDEYEDFYDFSSSYEDEELGDRVLEVSPIGELVLLDGRHVGHRDLRRYYKQRFQPEDTRPAVLAQRREDLLRFSSSLRENGEELTSSEVQLLSDAQLVNLVLKKRREFLKEQRIAQRAHQRDTFRCQRREYQSTLDKLRSSATTTDKIRDYHGMLK